MNIQDSARRLIAYESADDTPSAVIRVSEKLRRPLCMLAGAAGFRSLLSRALTLAKREIDGFDAVSVKPDGSLDGLSGLQDSDALDFGAALIAQMLGLLETFVGASLTLGIVHEVWPELSVDDTNSGRQDQHDPTRYKMQVIKLRGQTTVPGLHTFRITDAGLQAFSRALGLIGRRRKMPSERRLSMGIPELDEMLAGGIPATVF